MPRRCTPVAQCQWCESSNHLVEDCQAMRESSTPKEQLAFIANARRLDPYSNTYNEGWRQHPNFSWNSNTTKPPGFPAPAGGFQQRQPHSSSPTSLGRGNHSSSPSVSMPSQQQLRL
ncbi:unnamed protein product [Linum trigynum]|uniref:Uncharacterized protein n=1 Tax=Linum trigynum TaxID=586398 RepID=A0AAV2DAR0_9ROSI